MKTSALGALHYQLRVSWWRIDVYAALRALIARSEAHRCRMPNPAPRRLTDRSSDHSAPTYGVSSLAAIRLLRTHMRTTLAAAIAPAPSFDASAPRFGTAGAAWYLCRAPITLRKWRCRGVGPKCNYVNGRALYERADLDFFLSQHPKFANTSERDVAMAAA